MVTVQSFSQIEKLRTYSSVFSRMSLYPVVENGDYSLLDIKIQRYDSQTVGKKIFSYLDYLKYAYSELRKNYRCEYIYKNTLVNELIKRYGTNNSVIFNEFRVGKSVADMVMFNGTSKAFEIKTELDSDKRLDGQLSDYSKIFRESYIVTHESLADKYAATNETVGIIAMTVKNGKLSLEEKREAVENKSVDVDVLMRSIRTNEYKNIVSAYYKLLPDVGNCDMYVTCKEMIRYIPQDELQRFFLNEMKKRKTNNPYLKSYHDILRQFCLSANINKKQYDILKERLSKPISI